MDELKKLIEALGRAFEEFKAANDLRIKALETKGSVDVVLAEKVDRINKDLTAISEMKKQVEAIETAIAQGQLPGGSPQSDKEKIAKAQAFMFLMRGSIEAVKDIEVQAAASTLSDPDGGFTVPEEVDKAIDRVQATMSAMRRLATVRTISTDTYKKLVGQGGATAGWVAEKGARDETDTPTLREIAINAKEEYAMPAATQQLLDDSAVDIGSWLADEVGIVFDEQEGDSFINGNGVEKPKGIGAYSMVANASYAWGKVGYIAGGHASLLNNADKLIDLQHALKTSYRNGASWLMNDSTCQAVRKFKDGEGNYLWRPGLLEGAPDILLGKPVEYDDNVDDIGTNKYPIFYGNFKRGYLIIDRLGTRVLRDPFTSKPYILFYTTKRVGGGIVMYEAIKALKISA
jgi:HK97 family phage major capsid protein